LLSISLVAAHSNILYGISLDFDETLKTGVTSAAQAYLETDEVPVKFDYDRELLTAKFDRLLELSVTMHPSDFSVFGFRDDSLVSRGSEEAFDTMQRKEIAQKIFDNIPNEYKKELVYSGEKKLYSGTYKYTWFRYVGGIYVINDHLEVEIDPVDGDTVAWRLSPFFYRKEELPTVPALSYSVAQNVAQLRMSAEKMDFKPVLLIYNDRLVWLTKVKALYPIFAAIDAADGSLVFAGSPRGEIPLDYDYGREVKVIENEFIKNVYGGIDG